MIYIAIPSITPRLADCAQEAIRRTTPEPHRVGVIEGRRHGEALDYALATLPSEATHLFTMDDDAAPLKIGWLTWMREQMGGLDYLAFGQNMVVGCLYRAVYLRRAASSFSSTDNPGDAFRNARFGWSLGRDGSSPWWLTNCEGYRDSAGDL